jgi:urease accessory protein UreF
MLSTTRQIADLDYVLMLLADLCFHKDANVQKVVVENILSRQATATTADEWVARIEKTKEIEQEKYRLGDEFVSTTNWCIDEIRREEIALQRVLTLS